MLPKCAQPHSLWYFFRPPVGFAEPPSFRLSRDVCEGTSNRKPATAALNLLGPLRGARAPSAACLLGARLEVDVTLPRRLGPVERAAPPRALTGLRRLVTVLGLVKVATRPGSLRASLAGARRTPSRLRRPGPPGGARRRGWWRLPDEAAQSAGSEPFEVRVLPEGCPVAGRPGTGAVRLPRQAPKKSGYSKGEQLGRCLPKISASPLA